MNKQTDQTDTYSAILIDVRGQREEKKAFSVKKLHEQIKGYLDRSDIDVFIHEYHNGEKKFFGRSSKWRKNHGNKKRAP